jgi:hypothetical protein
MPRATTASPSTSAALPEASQHSKHGLPPPWWQWVLMYPTLAVAIIGAVPTYYEWVKPGEDQSQFWERNAACYQEAPTPQAVITKGNDRVEVTVCPTGDVLIKVTPSNTAEPVYQWIGHETLTKKIANSLLPGLQEALAEERQRPGERLVPSGSRVICQRREANGLILRIIALANGQCRQEMIHPSTGKVVKSGSAPCNRC